MLTDGFLSDGPGADWLDCPQCLLEGGDDHGACSNVLE